MTVNEFVEAKKFHGDVADSSDLVTKLRYKDSERQKMAVEDYISKFDNYGGNVEMRQANYTKLVNNFYDLGAVL